MTAKDIVAELKKLGNAQTKKTWMAHGAQEPCLGVKVEDMKKIQKRVKMDYRLALDLYACRDQVAPAARGEVDPPAAQSRQIRDEQFRHRRRLPRQTAPQARGRYGQRHRQGRRRPSRGMHNSVRARSDQEIRSTQRDRQEAQVAEVLIGLSRRALDLNVWLSPQGRRTIQTRKN